jgi:hypothetical protein
VITIRTYQPEDFGALWPRIQQAQATFAPALSPGYADLLAEHGGSSWTAEWNDHVVALGGLQEIWEGRAMAWAFLACDAPMLRLTRAVSTLLRASPFRRVECWVDPTFAAGHRWAELLGFELEGLARAYLPDGGDAAIYSLIWR